ncbi:MAG: Zn-dependent oligopeptidase [Reichenbachiella sp.]
MKLSIFCLALLICVACSDQITRLELSSKNPFVLSLNEATDFAAIKPEHIDEYGKNTIDEAISAIQKIKSEKELSFDNVFISLDNIFHALSTVQNKSFLLYWVSTDSLTRVKGLAMSNKIDSLMTLFVSDGDIFSQMTTFKRSDDYANLEKIEKRMVNQVIEGFELSGVNLEEAKLSELKKLKAEINDLTSQYSINMNTADQFVILDKSAAEGLSENFLSAYVTPEGNFKIPATPTTRSTVLKNAKIESTRKEYYLKITNRASEENLVILDSLVSKRYQIAQIMGYNSYAEYNLADKMANNTENVWEFVNGLISQAKPKAKSDLETLKKYRNQIGAGSSNESIKSWNLSYYMNEIMKSQYEIDHEKVREYLSMDRCLAGMMNIYQELLGLEFRKVENGSVWHEDVEMYEVFEEGNLKGRFYLDLFPRPNKESWFYGVTIKGAKSSKGGFDIPENMLLGNFPEATDSLPSLITFSQLSTLFHEFGHIMDAMSDNGKYAMLQDSKSDFVESMSQIFENWIYDYETLSSLAVHYKTGETFPKELFDKMNDAKNFMSGYGAIRSLRYCVYDLNLYDNYDPEKGLDTDDLWQQIDNELGLGPLYVEGTHPQSSWIHINTHPVYFYGYLWSEVYAQDMFTVFEKNGLRDTETGLRYRNLILSNGSQRDIEEAVEEFIGRPSNNEAYIKSLGLE